MGKSVRLTNGGGAANGKKVVIGALIGCSSPDVPEVLLLFRTGLIDCTCASLRSISIFLIAGGGDFESDRFFSFVLSLDFDL